MAVRKILHFPDPKLRKKAKPVQEIDKRVRTLLSDMAETMYAAPGIGLAAPQIGIDERLVVIDIGDREDPEDKGHLYQFINPEIVSRSGSVEWEEGCLSIPEVKEKVQRSAEVVLEALDEKGNTVTIDAKGLLAVCIQHEIDHLDGILFIDRLSRLRKELIRSKLDRLRNK